MEAAVSRKTSFAAAALEIVQAHGGGFQERNRIGRDDIGHVEHRALVRARAVSRCGMNTPAPRTLPEQRVNRPLHAEARIRCVPGSSSRVQTVLVMNHHQLVIGLRHEMIAAPLQPR